MLPHEDIVDRKIVSFIARSETSIASLIQYNITPDFFLESYQTLVEEILDYYRNYSELITVDVLSKSLIDKNKNIDSITAITATLDDIINDPDLATAESSLKEFDFFVDRIKKRKTLEIFKKTAIELGSSVDASRIEAARNLLMQTITKIDKINNTEEISEGTLSDFAELRIKRYEERKTHPERFKGIQSGFPILDSVTDGFQPGDLIIYVAESGGGKSVNLLHSAFQSWCEKYPGAGVGANVVLFSLEMDWAQYLRRWDAMHSHVEMLGLKSGNLLEKDYSAWEKSIEEQKKKPNMFYLVDMPSGCNTIFIKNKLQEIRVKEPNRPIDLVVIDYLGIMSSSQQIDGSDWLIQGLISQECKELARSEKVAVLTAVQETRESVKEGKAKNKSTAVLSRSGMIVTNANIILYSKLRQLTGKDDDSDDLFKYYNSNPNVLEYQTIKSRDSSRPSFACGVNFSKMYVQPICQGTDGKTWEPINIKKQTPQQQLILDPEDEEEFGGYYENVQNNTVDARYQLDAI